MTNQEAEQFIVKLAQSGTQAATAVVLACSQAAVARRFKAARELIGDIRALELIAAHQRDAACGVTLRKPFIMSSGTCGVCGGVKTRQPSGKLRCNACRTARYRAEHPAAVKESVLSPEDEAVKFLITLATAGTQAEAAKVMGTSKWVVSDRLTKSRKLLGDAAVMAVLKKHQRDEKCGHTLLKSFYINSIECRKCGMPRKALATTGELVCQSCSNKRNREYKARHPERITSAAVAYRVKNHVALIEKGRAYRAANPTVYQDYYKENTEKIKATVMRYRLVNKEKIQNYYKSYAQNPEFRDAKRAILRAWKKRNPDRVNAGTARYYTRKLQAYAAWANDALIQEFYALAQLRTQLTGIAWQVDHIVPLNSDVVCGMHCEANLQVIPAVTNLAKSNDWWPDMFSAPTSSLAAFFELPSLYLVAPSRACLSAPSTASANEPLMEAA